MTFDQANESAMALQASAELVTKRFAVEGQEIGRLYLGKLRIVKVLGKPAGRRQYEMWCAVKPVHGPQLPSKFPNYRPTY